MTAYANDNFNKPDTVSWGSTPLGGFSWAAGLVNGTAGGFTIDTYRAKCVTPASSDVVASINTGQSDGAVGITVLNSNVCDGALLFRMSDTSNFWILWPDPIAGVHKLMKRVAGAYSQVGANGPSVTSGSVLSVTLSGSSIKAYVNGALIWTITDGHNSTATLHGVRQGGGQTGYYENFYHESGQVAVAPNDANIVYSPYNWDVNGTRAKTINAGAYLKARFSGGYAGLTLNFDVSGLTAPNPWIKYRVDGGAWTKAQVSASVNVAVPSENSWGIHTLEVVVQATSEFVTRWSPQNAHVSLTSISGTGLSPTLTTQKATLNALVFADSIGEGYKSLMGSSASSPTPDGSDSTLAFPYRLADKLGAEVGVVAFGGTGWTVAGVGGVPALPTSYVSLWGSGPTRDFITVIPDIIIINLGENDNTADIVSTATNMINDLLTRIPATTLVAIMRPFSGREASNIQTVIANVNSNRVKYVDTTGWFSSTDASDGQHPYGYISETLAANLAVQIRKILNGGGMYLNVAGVARAVTNVRR